MRASHLHDALMRNPHTYKVYGGIYARDRLPPVIKTRPLAIIANTHKAHQPGQHWVAFYFDRNGQSYYFDSYGLPPVMYPEFVQFLLENNRSSSSSTTMMTTTGYKYNNIRLQGSDINCGMYCLYFILTMIKHQFLYQNLSKQK